MAHQLTDTGTEKGKWLPAALALSVFVLGASLAWTVFDSRVEQQRRSQAAAREEQARQYAFLAQRQLDAYAVSSLSLAAYVSTVPHLDDAGLNAFVRAARHFSHLKGIRAVGFLPRVAAADADALERQVDAELPGYRIRNKRPGADYHYPLLYVVDPDSRRAKVVRGIDYTAIPVRLAAINRAEASGVTAASAVHPSIFEATRAPVVLTFTPVRTAATSASQGGGRGVVHSVMRVTELFEGIDGRMGKDFRLVVDEQDGGTRRPVYASGGAGFAAAPFHTSQLTYADRRWTMRVHARADGGAGIDGAARAELPLLASGVLGAALAAWAVIALTRRQRARRAAAELAQRFEYLLDDHPFAVHAMDGAGRLVYANRTMQQELGLAREQLLGRPVTDFIDPAGRREAEAALRKALAGQGLACQLKVIKLSPDSGAEADRRVEMAAVLVPVKTGGQVTRVLCFAENVTERRRVERELYESRQMLRHVLDTIPEGVFWKDLDSRFLGANRQMALAAGLACPEHIAGRLDADMPWAEHAPEYVRDDRKVMESGVPSTNVRHRHVGLDGALRWLEVSKVPLTDAHGAVVGILGVSRDITEHKRMEQELERRANHDSLTGLPNRAYFHTQLRQAVIRARRRQAALALLYFDIDCFKQINDTHGHGVGDEVIRLFADRVCASLRESDFVARLGGDEFGLIVEAVGEPVQPDVLATKVLAAMRPPMQVGELELQLSTSIGIAQLHGTMDADGLIRAADEAMYEAKRAGRNCFRMQVLR